MLLKDVYTVDVVCCASGTTVAQAARLMREKHVGDVVVVADPEKNRTALGVVTDRDLALEVLGRGLDPGHTPIDSLMHKPVVLARESEDTAEVLERMRTQGVRRVPVVDAHGAVVGIITLDDLLRLLIGDANALLQIMDKAQSHERHARR
jgi:CBS domain-containing protein